MAIRKIPNDTKCFHFFNTNPKNHRSSDCVIRAISMATGKSWDDVLDGLVTIAHKVKGIPNEPKCYETYLNNLGWVTMKMPKKENGKRYTAGEWALENNNIIMIITVANHMTCSVNGIINDIWDCSEKSVCKYWIRERVFAK